MFELLALAVAGTAAVFGHLKTRDFTRRRLRYTKVGESPVMAGLVVGVGTAVVAAPLVALLPVVGAGTALALGAGVGTGMAMGARERVPERLP